MGGIPLTDYQNNIIKAILAERTNQDDKWGDSNILSRSRADAYLVLAEEVGEVAKEILEDGDSFNYTEELIQVAAVALAAIEAEYERMDSERKKPTRVE